MAFLPFPRRTVMDSSQSVCLVERLAIFIGAVNKVLSVLCISVYGLRPLAVRFSASLHFIASFNLI